MSLQNSFEKLRERKLLLFSLFVTGTTIIVSTFFGKETVKMTSDFMSILTSGVFALLSIILSSKFRKTGSHGTAWLIFTGTAISWFIAETIWAADEFVYHINPFPSFADVFYLMGYPFILFFSVFYLKPFKKLISRKMILLTSLVSITVLIPSLYMTIQNNSGESQYGIVLSATYPIADAIILVPAMIGIFLFFKGEVNFLWTLLLIGILFEVIADTGFQYFTLNNSYYTGHPIDILFIWSYLLFSFGVYNHIQIFRTSKKINESNNLV